MQRNSSWINTLKERIQIIIILESKNLWKYLKDPPTKPILSNYKREREREIA